VSGLQITDRQVRTGQVQITGWPQLLGTVPQSGGVPSQVSAGVSGAQQTPAAVQTWVPGQSTQATPRLPHVVSELVRQTPAASQQPLGQVVALQTGPAH
jgi:hypothetical protein